MHGVCAVAGATAGYCCSGRGSLALQLFLLLLPGSDSASCCGVALLSLQLFACSAEMPAICFCYSRCYLVVLLLLLLVPLRLHLPLVQFTWWRLLVSVVFVLLSLRQLGHFLL